MDQVARRARLRHSNRGHRGHRGHEPLVVIDEDGNEFDYGYDGYDGYEDRLHYDDELLERDLQELL